MKNSIRAFAMFVALSFVPHEAESARLTLTLSTNFASLTPIHSRVGFADTIIVKSLSANATNLSVETPLSATPTVKSIVLGTNDTIISNDLGAYIFSVGNVSAYAYTYQKNTITVTYKSTAPSSWASTATNGTPTTAKLGDEVLVVATNATSTSMIIRDPASAGYTMTMTAATGPFLPFTLTKAGLWSVIQFTTIRANITVSNDKVTPTSYNQLDANSDFAPYPNPATEVVNFVGYGELYDLLGNKVAWGTNNVAIEALSNGFYILRIGNKTTKIVKK